MSKLSAILLESDMISPVKSSVNQLRAGGFHADYEWDPHNDMDPFVTFYVRVAGRLSALGSGFYMEDYAEVHNILRGTLVGWSIGPPEENGDVVIIEAKPPVE